MEQANALLEEARVAGTLGARRMEMDGDGGEETYIEMVSLNMVPAWAERRDADGGTGSWIGRVGAAGWGRWGERGRAGG
jgi:hypothetical protein